MVGTIAEHIKELNDLESADSNFIRKAEDVLKAIILADNMAQLEQVVNIFDQKYASMMNTLNRSWRSLVNYATSNEDQAFQFNTEVRKMINKVIITILTEAPYTANTIINNYLNVHSKEFWQNFLDNNLLSIMRSSYNIRNFLSNEENGSQLATLVIILSSQNQLDELMNIQELQISAINLANTNFSAEVTRCVNEAVINLVFNAIGTRITITEEERRAIVNDPLIFRYLAENGDKRFEELIKILPKEQLNILMMMLKFQKVAMDIALSHESGIQSEIDEAILAISDSIEINAELATYIRNSYTHLFEKILSYPSYKITEIISSKLMLEFFSGKEADILGVRSRSRERGAVAAGVTTLLFGIFFAASDVLQYSWFTSYVKKIVNKISDEELYTLVKKPELQSSFFDAVRHPNINTSNIKKNVINKMNRITVQIILANEVIDLASVSAYIKNLDPNVFIQYVKDNFSSETYEKILSSEPVVKAIKEKQKEDEERLSRQRERELNKTTGVLDSEVSSSIAQALAAPNIQQNREEFQDDTKIPTVVDTKNITDAILKNIAKRYFKAPSSLDEIFVTGLQHLLSVKQEKLAPVADKFADYFTDKLKTNDAKDIVKFIVYKERSWPQFFSDLCSKLYSQIFYLFGAKDTGPLLMGEGRLSFSQELDWETTGNLSKFLDKIIDDKTASPQYCRN